MHPYPQNDPQQLYQQYTPNDNAYADHSMPGSRGYTDGYSGALEQQQVYPEYSYGPSSQGHVQMGNEDYAQMQHLYSQQLERQVQDFQEITYQTVTHTGNDYQHHQQQQP